jgi:hypothetical protein
VWKQCTIDSIAEITVLHDFQQHMMQASKRKGGFETWAAKWQPASFAAICPVCISPP